jgi:hypothetical protein
MPPEAAHRIKDERTSLPWGPIVFYTIFHNSGQLRSMIKSIGISPHGKHNILLDIADLYKAKYGKGIKVYNSSSPYNGQ